MDKKHLPILGRRYWAALCLASIFGANMGDFFAHNLGLGHVAGLPILAVALAAVLLLARSSSVAHQAYYWLAIIIVRTAATNFADFAAADMRLPRTWVIAGLTFLLILTLYLSARFLWRQLGEGARRAKVLCADTGYWISMFLAGTLGTVIGDYFSHNLSLGNAEASIILSALLGVLFLFGYRGLLWTIPFYWLTVVMVRAAGTVVGDLLASREQLGLPLSTLVTGALFTGMLVCWKESTTPTLIKTERGLL